MLGKMGSPEFADELFAGILEQVPQARRLSENSIAVGPALVNRVVADDNVSVIVTENIPVAVFQAHGAQAVRAEMRDFDPRRADVDAAIADLQPWIRAYAGVN